MKHNYKPLTTFRGWSEEQNGWVYGDLFHHAFDVAIQPLHSPNYFNVNKDSIGIYTGRDDANGTPIFCGVDGALYGGDILKTKFEDDESDFIVVFEDMSFRKKYKEWDETLKKPILNELEISILGLTVFRSQYEQHLKENSK